MELVDKREYQKVLDETHPSQIFFKEKKMDRFDQLSTLKNDFENQNFEMFEKVAHNFGKSDGDII